MLIDHAPFRRPLAVADLPDDAALLLWSLRRMVIAWPRCHTVHAALHVRYGDTALGIEHLLRCWLLGVSRHARRQLVIGDPNCALLLGDEPALLAILDRAAASGDAATALVALTGNPCAGCLLPLVDSLVLAAEL
jgi:hypothetical protein